MSHSPRYSYRSGTALLSALAFTTVLASGSARAGLLLDVQFGGGQYNSSPSGTQSGPAEIGSAGDFWNEFSNRNTPSTGSGALMDAGDNPSNVDLSYSFGGGYTGQGAPSNNSGNGFYDTQYANLMLGFFSAYSTPSTVTLTNLPANTQFNLYLYGEGNGTNDRQTVFSTSGGTGTLTLTPNKNLGTFTSPTDNPNENNYGVLSTTSDATGTLTITVAEAPGNTNEADFNGFQLQEVPEPSTVWLVPGCAAILGLAFQRRFRRQA